jgi:hypothetical protein
MPKFVVYEIWTRAKVVEAENQTQALEMTEPEPGNSIHEELNFSNWHVVPLLEEDKI